MIVEFFLYVNEGSANLQVQIVSLSNNLWKTEEVMQSREVVWTFNPATLPADFRNNVGSTPVGG